MIDDINKAIPHIVTKNLFNIGLYWKIKENELNKNIHIKNKKSGLNILLIISKIKLSDTYKYNFIIKTVMRKHDFIPKESITINI